MCVVFSLQVSTDGNSVISHNRPFYSVLWTPPSLRVEQLTCMSPKLALLLPCSSGGVLESHNLQMAVDTLLPLSHPYLGFGVLQSVSESRDSTPQFHSLYYASCHRVCQRFLSVPHTEERENAMKINTRVRR